MERQCTWGLNTPSSRWAPTRLLKVAELRVRFWATCGRTFIERSSLTKSAASSPKSAHSVIGSGRLACGSIIASAAPPPGVAADLRQAGVEDRGPERFSIRAWPRKASFASMPGPSL